MRFEWDAEKARTNLRKHGVAFETACRVFSDPFRMLELKEVVDGEYRWQTIGLIEGIWIVVVVHTDRRQLSGARTVRIISARLADRRERLAYDRSRIGRE